MDKQKFVFREKIVEEEIKGSLLADIHLREEGRDVPKDLF